MRQYLDLLQKILNEGADRPNRTGTPARSLFGEHMRFDLAKGFPLLTTKRLHVKSIIHELLWFLSGETNIRALQEEGVRIWDAWADEAGELGPVYGKQWRSWDCGNGKTIDQMRRLINNIRDNPTSRRLIVSAWNPADIDRMKLPPCHCLFQFHVHDGRLSCQLYQRSADMFIGVPFNIASYALLTHMIAHVSGLKAGEFIHTLGDAHIYHDHFEGARLQLTRTPMTLPEVAISPEAKDLFKFRYEDIEIRNYEAHPHIKAPVAV